MSRKLRFYVYGNYDTYLFAPKLISFCVLIYLPHQNGILTRTIFYQQIYPEEHYIVARYSDIFLKPLQYPEYHPH